MTRSCHARVQRWRLYRDDEFVAGLRRAAARIFGHASILHTKWEYGRTLHVIFQVMATEQKFADNQPQATILMTLCAVKIIQNRFGFSLRRMMNWSSR